MFKSRDYSQSHPRVVGGGEALRHSKVARRERLVEKMAMKVVRHSIIKPHEHSVHCRYPLAKCAADLMLLVFSGVGMCDFPRRRFLGNRQF